MKDSISPGKKSASVGAAAGTLKQQRAVATRRDLIDAARQIFARDGFERARLQDISEVAGKTRGAFYAHFKDKEDVFYAIFEDDLWRDQEHVRAVVSAEAQREEQVDALARHLVQVLKDERRMLLSIEFKLFALRRPPKEKKRAENLHAALCRQVAGGDLETLFPQLRTGSRIRRAQMALFGAMLEGLALNQAFAPGAMSAALLFAQVRERLREILLLGSPAIS